MDVATRLSKASFIKILQPNLPELKSLPIAISEKIFDASQMPSLSQNGVTTQVNGLTPNIPSIELEERKTNDKNIEQSKAKELPPPENHKMENPEKTNQLPNQQQLENLDIMKQLKDNIDAIISEKQNIEKELYQLHMNKPSYQKRHDTIDNKYAIDTLLKEIDQIKSKIHDVQSEKFLIKSQIEIDTKALKEEEALRALLIVYLITRASSSKPKKQTRMISIR